MDATLSINRQYNRFVIPRLEYFKVNFPEVNSLNKLSTLIDEKGIYGFNVVWNYNHPKRVEILRDLTQFFLNNKKLVEIENDLDSMQKWAREVDISSGNFLPVSGIGFTTGQYIRKLLSVDTVKPDVHIKKAIFDGTGIKLSEMLDEIWEQYKDVRVKNGTDEKSLNSPYTNIQEKLNNNEDITELGAKELDIIIEILRNIDKTFRTYGKRAVGFGNYLTKVIKRRREY